MGSARPAGVVRNWRRDGLRFSRSPGKSRLRRNDRRPQTDSAVASIPDGERQRHSTLCCERAE
jgi:hypothetical protein